MKSVAEKRYKSQIIVLSLIVSILIVIAGITCYHYEKRLIQQDKYQEMKAVSSMKVNQLVQWNKERLSEVTFFSTSELLSQYTCTIINGNKTAEDVCRKALLHIMSSNRFENIFLLSKEGRLILSALPSYNQVDSITIRQSLEVIRKKQVVVRDFYLSPVNRKLHFTFIAPVFDKNNTVIASMVFQLNPEDYFFPLIQEWPFQNLTVKSYLVRKAGDYVEFLGPFRLKTEKLLLFQIHLSEEKYTAVRAVSGQEGMYKGIDYSGQSVLAEVRKVSGTSWYIISEINTRERYAELYKIAVYIILVAVMAILLVWVGIAWAFRNQQRKMYMNLYKKSQELVYSQEEFGATLYSIGDGVITTDEKGLIMRLNAVAEQMTGWTEKDAKGQQIEEVFTIIHEENRKQIDNPVRLVLNKGAVVKLAYQTLLISKDGKETPIADSGAPIKDSNDKIYGVVLVFRDQTEERQRRKLVETRLRLFEYATHHNMNETLNLMLNETGHFTQSPICYFLLLSSDETAITLQVCSDSTKEEIGDYASYMNLNETGIWFECVRTRKPMVNNHDFDGNRRGGAKTYYRLKNGMVVPVLRDNRIVALLGVANKPSGYSSVDIDMVSYLADIVWEVTDGKQKEALIQESEEKYRTLVIQMQLGLALHELILEDGKPVDYRFLDINPGFENITGLKRETIIGKRVLEVLPNTEPVWIENYGNVVLTGQPMTFENYSRELNRYYSVIVYKTGALQFAVIVDDITTRKKTEEKLFENRQTMSRLLDNLSGVAYKASYLPGWAMEFISKACFELTGYSDQDFYTKMVVWEDIVLEENKQTFKECIKQSVTIKSPYELEYRIRQKGGQLRWVWERGCAVYDSNDRVVALEGFVTDITHRKEAEEALRESEQNYRELIDSMTETAWIIDVNGNVMDVNKTATTVLGYTKEEILSIGLHGIDTSLKKEMTINMIKTMSEGKIQTFETTHRTKSGKIIPVEVNSSLVNYRGKRAILSIARNISLRKRDEGFQHLLYEIARTSMSTHALDDLLAVVRNELGKIMDATNFYLALYDPEADILKKVIFVNEKYSVESWTTEKTLSGYVLQTGKTLLLNHEDRDIFIKKHSLEQVDIPPECWLGVPLLEDQHAIGVLAIQSYTDAKAYDQSSVKIFEMVAHELSILIQRAHMIHDLVQAKDKAEESDRLKTAFLANVSHEIRTPMNGILGFMEMLGDPDIDKSQREMYIDIVNKSGQRLLATINDIVEISKIEAGLIEVYLSEFDLSETMDYHQTFFAKRSEEKGLKLILSEQIQGKDAYIKTDKHKLEGILTNLLNNAIKFTPAGMIEFGNRKEGESVLFFVRDTGIGIPANKLDDIFKRFVQADLNITRPYEGSGLGLSIVKAYLEKLGGKIWVESEVGKGSTFCFTIPYLPADAPLVEKDSILPITNYKTESLQVLIAEDDDISFQYLKALLQMESVSVLHCINGEDTVRTALEHPEISLILMDIKMPGMNGLEAIRQIRLFNSAVPIIAQTAYAFSNDRIEAMNVGCTDYLTKPLNRTKLIELIQKYINKVN